MNPLVIIPARGGSKGIPGKNIKPLNGRPLIAWSIDAARAITDDTHILVSTDSDEIARVVTESTGLPVRFMRPAGLATDRSGSRGVILHAMDAADEMGIGYDTVILLQPTSPMRTPDDIRACMGAYEGAADKGIDMAVTVTQAATNPYYNCYERDADGYLHISKGDGRYTRRQDAPEAWEYNGAVYVINPASIREMELGAMPRRVASVMPRERSVDLDTPLDWIIAEEIISHHEQ